MLLKYLRILFIIVIAFTLNTFGQRSCKSAGGQCLEVFNCLSARNSIQMFGMHSFQRCGWNGLVEKVCCLDTPRSNPIISTSSEEDVNIWTDEDPSTKTTITSIVTKTNEPQDRKSKTACNRFSIGTHLDINIHILGGEDAKVGEFPHMVAMGYPNPENTRTLLWSCAGSLISDRWVLSAAHCVGRIRPVRLLLGVLNITQQSSTRREYSIVDIKAHPEYVPRTNLNDIALLQTDSRVEFGDVIYPACLYLEDDDPLGLIITGWGNIYSGQTVRKETLQKARVIPVSITSCNDTYMSRLNRMLTSRQICAGPANLNVPTDSCPGDSGGPLQLLQQNNLYAVVGVVSFGLTDCGGDAPSVYTRVYRYLDWIEGIVWP